ncbi:MAG: hypothetical protein HYR49_09030 [Gammaproteobacteria bacterium]|nr:hypothetical protein [Gammaproteobacteria bacterium]
MACAVLCFCGVAGAPIAAQEVIDNSEHLESDRPESWAMNYFTSVTLLSGLSVPRSREPWSVEAAAEFGWIPQLSLRKRTVGFNGTKEEALNHSTIFARPRLTVGLPWRAALTLSYVPPLKIAGVRPHLFAFALEHPLYEREPLTLGARFYGQVGRARGAITCSEEVAGHPPGSLKNPFGCDEASYDKAIQRYLGIELSAAWRLERLGGLSPWIAVAGNYLDTEAHVRALTFGIPDRSVLDSETWTFSASGGVSYPLSPGLSISVGAFYSPLAVVRPPYMSTDNDALFNLRALISYEFQ